MPKPEANVGDSEVALLAHQVEGPKPTEQIDAWVEKFDEIRDNGFDLISSNPHLSSEQDIPKPWELTASLKERIRELSLIIDDLHKKLNNGEEE